jgi:hypothetical protein
VHPPCCNVTAVSADVNITFLLFCYYLLRPGLTCSVSATAVVPREMLTDSVRVDAVFEHRLLPDKRFDW